MKMERVGVVEGEQPMVKWLLLSTNSTVGEHPRTKSVLLAGLSGKNKGKGLNKKHAATSSKNRYISTYNICVLRSESL